MAELIADPRNSQQRRRRRRRRRATAAALVSGVAVIAVVAVATAATTAATRRSSSHFAASSSVSGASASTSLSVLDNVSVSCDCRTSIIGLKIDLRQREGVFSFKSRFASLAAMLKPFFPLFLSLTLISPTRSSRKPHCTNIKQLPAQPHASRRLTAVVGAFGGDIGSGPTVRLEFF